MTGDLFTFVCDFHGATYVSQVRGEDVTDAVRHWAKKVRLDKSIAGSSADVAKSVLDDLKVDPPTPLKGLEAAWCFTAFVGDSLVLGNVVRTR